MKIPGRNIISLPSHHNSHFSYLTLHPIIAKSIAAQPPTHASHHHQTLPTSSLRVALQAPLGQDVWLKPFSLPCPSAVA